MYICLTHSKYFFKKVQTKLLMHPEDINIAITEI